MDAENVAQGGTIERREIRFSIATKIIIAVAFLVGLVVSLFAGIDGLAQRKIFDEQAAYQRKTGEERARSQGVLVTRSLASSLAPAVAEFNYPYVKEVVTSTVAEDPNILFITVSDAEGTVAVDSRSNQQGQRLSDPINKRKEKELVQETKVKGQRAILFAMPLRIGEAVRGEIRLYYSLAFLERELARIATQRNEATRRLIIRTLLVGGGCVVVGILLAIFLAMSFTRPIRKLAGTAGQLAQGDLDARANLKSKDEIGQLGFAFNNMAVQIKSLLSETAEKVRLEKEVELARLVQESLIPPDRPLDLPMLEIAGFYRPAEVCGGDWWNYLMVGDNQLILIIGDVTGHGIGSAMVTASARSACDAVKSLFGTEMTLQVLMRTLNYVIYHVGERHFQMTCFAVMIDLTTGEMTISNAGHPMPYVRTMKNGKPAIDFLEARGNRLGDMPEWDFPSATCHLTSGDLLLLFTDGITEGENPEGVEFGEKRLRRTLKNLSPGNATEARDAIVKVAYEFYEQKPQDDDITFVVARVK